MSTGLKGTPVDSIISQFFGSLDRWPAEADGLNWTRSQVQAISQRMSDTGDCLWHAMAVVTDTVAHCHCARCMPGPIKAVRS